ncbi:MAG: hypothetical protein HY673_15705 [Chloroflexi bacterium]|nr:hypothetical protein [Chloroflexota bacterium]
MKSRKNSKCAEAEQALALAAYRNEPEKLRYPLQKALGKYGKPKVTIQDLRAQLSDRMGDVSLSRVIIEMREKGY